MERTQNRVSHFIAAGGREGRPYVRKEPALPSSKRFSRSALLLTVLTLVAGLAPAPAGAVWPPEPSNLQIFPADVDVEALVETMKSVSRALGVRCQFCHIGEEGMPLADFDFASDENKHKRMARQMFEMVRVINQDHIQPLHDEFEGDEEPVTRVRCVTCHRGQQVPQAEDPPPAPAGPSVERTAYRIS